MVGLTAEVVGGGPAVTVETVRARDTGPLGDGPDLETEEVKVIHSRYAFLHPRGSFGRTGEGSPCPTDKSSDRCLESPVVGFLPTLTTD